VSEFKTTDIYLAAYLRLQGFEVLDIRPNGGKKDFVFPDSGEREQATLDFYNQAESSQVTASSFVDSYKAVKALTYELKAR
jgi:hypothetical protein